MTGGEPIEHFVLFLQEVFRAGDEVPLDGPEKYTTPRTQGIPPSGPRIDIVQTARRLGLSLFYVPSMRNGGPGSGTTEEDRGNAILTTIPMEDFTAIELPLDYHRRVAVAASAWTGFSACGLPGWSNGDWRCSKYRAAAPSRSIRRRGPSTISLTEQGGDHGIEALPARRRCPQPVAIVDNEATFLEAR